MKVFQLQADYKSCKPYLGLFFDIFSAAHTSQDNACDQTLISLRPRILWFDHFAFDWGHFLKHFMLVKHVTSKDHLALCLSLALVGWVCSCKSNFLKYWSKMHFHHPIPSHHFRLTHVSPKEVKMKEIYMHGTRGSNIKKDLVLLKYSLFEQKNM